MPLSQDSMLPRKDASYWRGVYENTLKRLAELRAERDAAEARLEALSREILQFEQVLTSLQPLTSDGSVHFNAGVPIEGIAELGLADACREILKSGTSYRTARGIRDSLAASSYDLEQHSNPLASIHGVLKRLAESGEVEQLESGGKTRYRWKTKQSPTVTKSTGTVMTVAERAITKAVEAIMNEPAKVRNAIEAEAKRKS